MEGTAEGKLTAEKTIKIIRGDIRKAKFTPLFFIVNNFV